VGRLASNDSTVASPALAAPRAGLQTAPYTQQVDLHGVAPMNGIEMSQHDEKLGDGRPVRQLVGRDPEMARLGEFLAVARISGGALLVTGEPGVGKTGILHAAAEAAAAAGTRVLRAAGVEFEAETSFSGLNQVLLPLLADLPELPAVHRDALNVALGFSNGGPPSRLVVSNAALVLLRQAATSRSLIVIIDDLPWLDRASAGVLSFVARRLEGSHVGLLGAFRSGEEDFFGRAGLPELELLRLDEGAAGQLLDARFPDLAPTVRERILVEAQGNPLALLELPVGLSPGMRASAKAMPAALPLSRRLQALFGSRITELPPRTRQLLLLMALDGTGDMRVLEAGAGGIAGFRDVAAAEQARLAYVDPATHRLAFHHPLIRSAVVDLSRAEERRTAHRRLADVWTEQPDRRAWHLAEATIEPDESVAAQLEGAAGRILARGDAVGCVKALTRASELSPGKAERHRRLAAAAYVGADVAGDLGHASNVLAELRRGEMAVEGSLQAAVAASAFLLNADGDVATAHHLLVGAIESRQGRLDARDPVLAEALHSLLMVCTYGEEELWRPFEEAMARTEGIPVALYLNSKTFADPAHAEASAFTALEAAITSLADESDPKQIIRIATAATYVDRLGGCREALWRVVHDARHGGAVASGIMAMLQLGYDDFQTGSWDEAEQLVEEAKEACRAHGYQNLMWPCQFLRVVLMGARGEEEKLQKQSAELLQWARPRGIRAAQWRVSQARGLAALGRFDFEEAYQHAIEISPPGILAPHVPHALNVLLDLVEAALRTGRDAQAAAHVAAMQKANLPGLSSRLALVVGGSAAMAAPDAEALELFESALALPGVERWQFDLARVRLAYGERLRRRRAMRDARVQLDAARAIFERLRAGPWVARASAELGATGQAKPHSGDNVLDRLTPQEFEIVSLAATGLTNKQIAERLFLSPRTVSGHLHRAFPKLGVATRAALRDALEAVPRQQLPRK
jgi:DNA-binding CsgD family transcriptional regulator